jgi:hypothetical protein
MRIRTIKPEFFTHEGIQKAEEESGLPLRLAFIGLWCAADREGRFKWEPRRLGVMIMPYETVDFSAILEALAAAGFVVRYGGGRFGLIASFAEHQRINPREAASQIPAFDTTEQDDSLQRTCRISENESRGMQECGEGKGKEGNKEGKGKTESVPGYTQNGKAATLERIVKAYPQSGSYTESMRVLSDLSSQGFDLSDIFEKVKVHAARITALPAARRQFCPGKEKYFEGRRFEESPDIFPWVYIDPSPKAKPAFDVQRGKC